MANFFKFIKMANFCVIKIANFFYQNGEFRLSKWRTSFSAFSQNGELFAFVIECLIRLHTKKLTFAFQGILFSDVQKMCFLDVQKCRLSRPGHYMSRAKSERF